jgi:hypothetical protein
MKKYLIWFFSILAISTICYAAAGDRAIHVNSNQDGDSYIQVNKGGVATKALTIVGATGKIKPGADGFDTSEGGLATDTSSGLISYYRRDTNVGTFTNMTTSPSITAVFVRSGDLVTMYVTEATVALTKNAVSGPMTLSGLVPSWARPATQVDTAMQAQINGTRGMMYTRVTNTGDILMYSANFGNVTASSVNNGVVAGATASWIVN